ncbi:MAG: hypothetical protein CMM32_05440 [Rhodospirillaceae bacterium]|nr:hypothetical protein [Rhodospirillaceae bacterium]
MHKIHILTKGFQSPNGIAFLFPFIVYRKELADCGIQTKFFTSIAHPKLCDCDVLFIESRSVSHRWEVEGDQAVLMDLSRLAESVPLVWFDISDSSGWLQPQVLPFVRWYCKGQLLKDKSLYMKKLYGNRLWADYYHQSFGATDSTPARNRVLTDPSRLGQLRLSWNSGLANYSMYGPHIMGLRRFIPINALFWLPKKFVPSNSERTVALSCRMGTKYERETVSYQRKKIQTLLKDRLSTRKLSRRAYYQEMRETRLVISPFGFGEITLKDFEATLCGATLLKPDMSHMETWPNLFVSGKTILTHSWDLSDFMEKLSMAYSCPHQLKTLAECAQQTYREELEKKTSEIGFCNRVVSIVHDTVSTIEPDAT